VCFASCVLLDQRVVLAIAQFSSSAPMKAHQLSPQLADLVKLDRLNRLNAVVNEVAEERAQRFAGRELEVRLTSGSQLLVVPGESTLPNAAHMFAMFWTCPDHY